MNIGGSSWSRARRCPGSSAPGGDALCRTRRIVRGGCGEVVRRVLAAGGRRFPVRSPRQVVQGVRLVGSRLAGEQAVRLRSQELSPGRPDPAWRRPAHTTTSNGTQATERRSTPTSSSCSSVASRSEVLPRAGPNASTSAAETIEQAPGRARYRALQSSWPVEGRLALKKAVPRRSAKNLGNEPLVPG